MDFLNNKKLKEKETEITELQNELARLKAEVSELKEEKQKELKLHQDVVDTMLEEVQKFIIENHEKKLSFKTLDTLLPLVEESIDTNYLVILIEIIPPLNIESDKLLISLSEQYCEGWVSEGLIKPGVVQDFHVNQKNRKETKFVTRTIYSAEDLVLKLRSLHTDIYDLNAGKGVFKPEKFSIEKMNEKSISLYVNYNVKRRRHRGFP